MLLSYLQLVELCEAGVVYPILPGNINGSSIDITLGHEVMTEVLHSHPMKLSVSARQQPAMRNVVISQQHPYLLQPGEFILTHSAEIFNLPADISAEFKLKSSLARMGLNQLTACWCDPTWHGSHITLELTNVTRSHVFVLQPGDKIGQMVFFRHLAVPDEHSYARRGRYNNDRGVSGIKP